ncbi:MAG: flagellar L-ring protein precursor FlgH [Chlamydiales bacterium]|jgi:flagellar L-ring protein precursor FlgH
MRVTVGRVVSLFLLISCPLVAQMGSLYELDKSPFASDVAGKAGDILTVIVMESAVTSDTGKRDGTKKHELTWELGKFFFPYFLPNVGPDDTVATGTAPGMEMKTEQKYTTKATKNSEHSVKTEFQVRIIEEIIEGQFVVRGTRKVTIDGTDKDIYLSGIIRSSDIGDDNTIESHLIADAVIEIDGKVVGGELAPGYIGTIFDKMFF